MKAPPIVAPIIAPRCVARLGWEPGELELWNPVGSDLAPMDDIDTGLNIKPERQQQITIEMEIFTYLEIRPVQRL